MVLVKERELKKGVFNFEGFSIGHACRTRDELNWWIDHWVSVCAFVSALWLSWPLPSGDVLCSASASFSIVRECVHEADGRCLHRVSTAADWPTDGKSLGRLLLQAEKDNLVAPLPPQTGLSLRPTGLLSSKKELPFNFAFFWRLFTGTSSLEMVLFSFYPSSFIQVRELYQLLFTLHLLYWPAFPLQSV